MVRVFLTVIYSNECWAEDLLRLLHLSHQCPMTPLWFIGLPVMFSHSLHTQAIPQIGCSAVRVNHPELIHMQLTDIKHQCNAFYYRTGCCINLYSVSTLQCLYLYWTKCKNYFSLQARSPIYTALNIIVCTASYCSKI